MAASGFGGLGEWASGTGSGYIVVDIVEDLAAATDYIFSFVVANPRTSQLAAPTEVTLDGIFLDEAMTQDSRVTAPDTGNVAGGGIYHPGYLSYNDNSTTYLEGTANPMYHPPKTSALNPKP